MKVNGVQTDFYWVDKNILQNILFSVLQKNKTHSRLERHEASNESSFYGEVFGPFITDVHIFS